VAGTFTALAITFFGSYAFYIFIQAPHEHEREQSKKWAEIDQKIQMIVNNIAGYDSPGRNQLPVLSDTRETKIELVEAFQRNRHSKFWAKLEPQFIKPTAESSIEVWEAGVAHLDKIEKMAHPQLSYNDMQDRWASFTDRIGQATFDHVEVPASALQFSPNWRDFYDFSKSNRILSGVVITETPSPDFLKNYPVIPLTTESVLNQIRQVGGEKLPPGFSGYFVPSFESLRDIEFYRDVYKEE
jgi:hypothetical protein